MKPTSVLFLCATLILPSSGWGSDSTAAIQKKLAKMPHWTEVVVHLKDGRKIRGFLDKVSATEFRLDVLDPGPRRLAQILLSDVHSVGRMRRPGRFPLYVYLGVVCGLGWIFTGDFCSEL